MWRRQNIEKSATTPAKQWMDRHEIFPEPNPLVLDAISNASCIVYGCGSLFTSLLPCLVLDGIGFAISCRNIKKVLLLNGWYDCETSWSDPSVSVRRMDLTSIVKAVVRALDQGNVQADGSDRPIPLVTDFITHIFYPIGTEIKIDDDLLAEYCMLRGQHLCNQDHTFIQIQGIKSIPAETCSEGCRSEGLSHQRVFDPQALVDALLGLGCDYVR
jgi:hypothetical protein